MGITDFFERVDPKRVSQYERLHPHEVLHFTERVLQQVDGLPPDPSYAYDLTPEQARCAVLSVGSHWGIYGAGVVASQTLAGIAFRYQLLLDPAWLDRDLRRADAGQPWLVAAEAEWATNVLQRLLHLEIPPLTVLRASLPPSPLSITSGDRSEWPSSTTNSERSVMIGTLGPPVSYQDVNGDRHVGYLTAAHVVPPDPALSQVDVLQGGAVTRTVDILRTGTMTPLGAISASVLQGDVDAAIVDAGGDPVVGIGPQGSAGARADVQRITGDSTATGEIVGYSRWMGTAACGWADCYVVASKQGEFAARGHSGSAVVADSDVIGIVVGGARSVAGCSSALTYVQDIDRIVDSLSCAVLYP